MKIINKEIETIVVINQDGSMKPLRIRLEENDELKVFKIENVLKMDELQVGKDKSRKFYCEVIVNERKQLIEIIYNLQTMKWILYRM